MIRDIIREATAADAPAICALWNPIIRDTVITFNPVEKTPDDIVALIAARQVLGLPFLIATGAEGGVLGFASFAQFRSGAGYAKAMEHSINLAPEARGRRLGHALMDALEARAEASGARMLIAAITASNAASIAFHHKRRYVEVGLVPEAGWKFGSFHDLLLMQLRFSDARAP